MGGLVTCPASVAQGGTIQCQPDGSGLASTGLVLFLFAIFCAYWAITTRRNALLWFILGFAFAPFTGLALLSRASDDRRNRP